MADESPKQTQAPGDADAEGDIRSQLDALLSDGDGDGDGEDGAAIEQSAASETDGADEADASAGAPEAITADDTSQDAAAMKTAADDDLDDQAESNEVDPDTRGAVEALFTEPASEPQTPDAGEIDNEAPRVEVPSAEADAGASDELAQIDQLLAEQAEGAVADEFDTAAAVASQDDGAAVDPSAPAEPIEGSFLTPEQLLADDFDVADTAGQMPPAATDVQVDEPAPAGTSVVQTQAPSPDSPADEAPQDKARLRLRVKPFLAAAARLTRDALRSALKILHPACAICNRPLDNVSPATRNLVGYAGIVTVFNACALLIGKALLTILG